MQRRPVRVSNKRDERRRRKTVFVPVTCLIITVILAITLSVSLVVPIATRTIFVPGNWTIQCPANYEGSLFQTSIDTSITGRASSIGIDCNGDRVFVNFTDTEPMTIASSKRNTRNVPRMTTETTVVTPSCTSCTGNMHHVPEPPRMYTPEEALALFNITIETEGGPALKRSATFPYHNTENRLITSIGTSFSDFRDFDSGIVYNDAETNGVQILTIANRNTNFPLGNELRFVGNRVAVSLYPSGMSTMIFITDALVTGACDETIFSQVAYDFEADRWILAGINKQFLDADQGENHNICLLISNTSDALTTSWTQYDFALTGTETTNERNLMFGVWGDYYTITHDTVEGAANGYAHMGVMERSVILAGDPSPRLEMFQLAEHDTLGETWRITPMDQRWFPRGPSITTHAPFGMFMGPRDTESTNATQDTLFMISVTNVDFDTNSVTLSLDQIPFASEVFNFDVGSCPSADECIYGVGRSFSIFFGEETEQFDYNPIRARLSTAYMYNPTSSRELLGWAAGTDMNGVVSSRISYDVIHRTGASTYVPHLDPTPSEIALSPGTYTGGQHEWAPGIAIQSDESIHMAWRRSYDQMVLEDNVIPHTVHSYRLSSDSAFRDPKILFGGAGSGGLTEIFNTFGVSALVVQQEPRDVVVHAYAGSSRPFLSSGIGIGRTYVERIADVSITRTFCGFGCGNNTQCCDQQILLRYD